MCFQPKHSLLFTERVMDPHVVTEAPRTAEPPGQPSGTIGVGFFIHNKHPQLLGILLSEWDNLCLCTLSTRSHKSGIPKPTSLPPYFPTPTHPVWSLQSLFCPILEKYLPQRHWGWLKGRLDWRILVLLSLARRKLPGLLCPRQTKGQPRTSLDALSPGRGVTPLQEMAFLSLVGEKSVPQRVHTQRVCRWSMNSKALQSWPLPQGHLSR